jgi:hypothetical protein
VRMVLAQDTDAVEQQLAELDGGLQPNLQRVRMIRAERGRTVSMSTR